MSDEAPASTDSGSSGGGGTSKIVLIASVVNMVATIGVIAVLMIAYQKDKSQPSMDDIVKGQVKGAHGGGGGGHGDAAKAEHGEGGEHGGGEHGGGEHGGGGGGSEVASDSGKMMGLDPFAVNLATGAGTNPRYARVNVAMELEQGAPYQEFEVKLPRVRDTIINLLNSKKPVELNSVEGRDQLKEEIKKSVNGYMSQSKVKGVYFTSFAISN